MSLPSEEIKSRLDVADVIGSYVKLTQSGANLKGLCPFHHEKTSSFYVSREKQIWHCFGCGLGGDVFSFVMKMESLEFPDALRTLADRAGIVLKHEDPRERSERSRMYDTVKEAMLFYEEGLADVNSLDVQEYLKGRGLSGDTIGQFRIGYATSNSWDALLKHLKAKGYRPEEAERAGLAVKGDRGDLRDKFHNRVMFPMFDVQGNPVGFSGRLFEQRHPKNSPTAPPKYLNSPETQIFNKSRLLYGLNFAKNAIREKNHAVLVEGQFDLILSHQSGVTHAVATSGTALTEQHVLMLKRYAPAVHTAFDSDSAGDMATKRSMMLFLKHDIAAHVISIEGGKDPADLVRLDAVAWHRAIETALPVIDFYLKRSADTYDFSDPVQKRKVADEILPLIRACVSPVLQGHYISRLSGVVGVDERMLHEAMRKLVDDLQAERPKQQEASAVKNAAPSRWTDIEEFLLAFLVKHRELAVPFMERLSEDHFAAPHTRSMFPYIQKWITGRVSPGAGDSASSLDLPAEFKMGMDLLLLKADRYAESLEKVDPETEIQGFIRELSLRLLRERLRSLGSELKRSKAELRGQILAEFTKVSYELQRCEKQGKISDTTGRSGLVGISAIRSTQELQANTAQNA